jgi:hypothetical protein
MDQYAGILLQIINADRGREMEARRLERLAGEARAARPASAGSHADLRQVPARRSAPASIGLRR